MVQLHVQDPKARATVQQSKMHDTDQAKAARRRRFSLVKYCSSKVTRGVSSVDHPGLASPNLDNQLIFADPLFHITTRPIVIRKRGNGTKTAHCRKLNVIGLCGWYLISRLH